MHAHVFTQTHTHTLTLSYVNRIVLLKTEFRKTTLMSMPVALKEPSFSYRFAEKPGVKWGSWWSGLVPLEGELRFRLKFSWWCSSLRSHGLSPGPVGTPRLLAHPNLA